MHGNVWKILAPPGTRLTSGDEVLVLEAMKMEVAVQATCDGTVVEVLCEAGAPAKPGQALVLIDTRDASFMQDAADPDKSGETSADQTASEVSET